MGKTNVPVVQEKAAKLKDLLMVRLQPAMQDVAPRHLTATRLARTYLMAVSRQPQLYECTINSILNCLMQTTALGLEIGGALGQAYMVPYKNNTTEEMEAVLIIGYRGLIDLARRTGAVESIEAHVVHANDRFTIRFGTNAVLEHSPTIDGPVGDVRGVYSMAGLKGKDAGLQFDFMRKDEVDRIREFVRAGKSGPWVDHYEEMARKTAARRLCKYLPMSAELAQALQTEDDAEAGIITTPIIDVEATVKPEPTTTDTVAQTLGVTPEEPHDVDSETG